MTIKKFRCLNLIIVILLFAWSIVGCMSTSGNILTGRIIFLSNRGGSYDLYVMNSDGSGSRKLASLPDLTASPNDNNGLIPSPDGKQIGFLSGRDGNLQIYTVDVEHGGLTNLTSSLAEDGSFAWSPDSKSIIFTSRREAALMDANRGLWTNDIFIMDTDGTHVRKLTKNNSANQYGELSWSPDGKKLALSMSSLSPYGPFLSNIYTMDVNDLVLSRSLSSPSDLVRGDPKWSPDSKHILYKVSGSKFSNLYSVNADGTNQIAITDKALGYVISASWSPDGDHILFSSKLGDKFSIYKVKADGTDLIELSRDPTDTSPSWSPDGKYIVFSSRRGDGKYHMYIMNADGSNQWKLTKDSGEEAASQWLLSK